MVSNPLAVRTKPLFIVPAGVWVACSVLLVWLADKFKVTTSAPMPIMIMVTIMDMIIPNVFFCFGGCFGMVFLFLYGYYILSAYFLGFLYGWESS